MRIEVNFPDKTLVIWNPKCDIKQIINPSTGIVEKEFAKEYFEYIDCLTEKDEYIEDYRPSKEEMKKILDAIYHHFVD